MTQDYYGEVEENSNDLMDFTKKKHPLQAQSKQEEIDMTFIKKEEEHSSGKLGSAEMNAEIEYMFWTSKKTMKFEPNQSYDGQILQVPLSF